MFSEELTTYLYSYNMPQKEEIKEPEKEENKVKLPIVNILQKACLTVPINLHHER